MIEHIPKNKIKFFQKSILKWYSRHGRHFPWRNKSATNYQKIISEVLLQRTKAETASRFFKKFVLIYPSWESLSKASPKKLEKELKPIGLYKQRAIRLHALAQEMVKRNGRFPNSREELDKIPFFGQYIANAVELFVYKKPRPLLDVNMARVLERFFGKRKLSDIRYDPYLQNLAQKVINLKRSNIINWAILDFASKICRSNNPLCLECLLKRNCLYFKNKY